MSEPINPPVLDIHTMEELQTMALHTTLVKRGIAENPAAFLAENTVKFTSTFRAGVGVAVVIMEITPLPAAKKPS